MPLALTSLRVITDDVARLVAFYEQALGAEARWATPEFAELLLPNSTLAIASSRTVPLFGEGCAEAAANRSVILEFRVPDVEAEHERLAGIAAEVVQPPTTMPWGNRSLLLRDPDGNLVNLFAPVTAEAEARQAR